MMLRLGRGLGWRGRRLRVEDVMAWGIGHWTGRVEWISPVGYACLELDSAFGFFVFFSFSSLMGI
jgi:hypothetical protein